ncbi:MAG: DNA methyltransferase [Candidatus Hodarchaeota archaeon]
MKERLTPLTLKDYQEDRNERGIFDKRNPLNDLTGKEWLFSTKTVIPKDYDEISPSQFKSRNYYPIPFQLSKEIIETYSKPGETILDPFAGIGSTLIGAHFSNEGSTIHKRKSIGFEINSELVTNFHSLSESLKISDQEMQTGNPFELLKEIKENSLDFIFSDIPIWNLFENEENEDVAMPYNLFCETPKIVIRKWLSSVNSILSESAKKLKKSKYIVIAIPSENMNENFEFITYSKMNFLLSSSLAHCLQTTGLILKAERIWFRPRIDTKEISFREFNRRFLIFKKESHSHDEIKCDKEFFDEEIPIGSTQILHKSFPPSFNHKLRSEHGGMKPPELTQLLIQKYSKHKNDVILDPFVGVGGTLLGASLTNRKAIGIDINKRWKEIYLKVSHENGLNPQKFIVDDAREVLDGQIKDGEIDLIVTDVPYWAMDKLKKTRGRFSKAGEDSRDKLPSSLKRFNQSSILTITEWLKLLEDVFSKCYHKLRSNKYLIVFIGNMYRTMPETRERKKKKVGRYLLLSALLAKELLNIGFQFEEEIVWYSPDKALHIFGYPYSYIPSVVHQSILVFKK